MSPPIPVVCAIIEDGAGKVLVAQRPINKHLGLKWEFAGGKVEANEAPEAALVREIKEELGCDIAIQRALPRFTYDYQSALIEMIPFVCTLVAGSAEPRAIEHAAIRWVLPGEMNTIDLAPADWPVLACYREGWKHQ